jgi:hypothetical protein
MPQPAYGCGRFGNWAYVVDDVQFVAEIDCAPVPATG